MKFCWHDWEHTDSISLNQLEENVIAEATNRKPMSIRSNGGRRVSNRICLKCGKYEDRIILIKIGCVHSLIKRQLRKNRVQELMEGK